MANVARDSSTSDRAVKRVAIFGMDGADLDLLGPWMDDGSLPALARLRANGSCGRLASTIPPLSPEAWSSFATGTNPGKHGVVNFVQPQAGGYGLMFNTGAARRGRTFWRLLGEADLRVGVVNVPMTYPPEPVHGFMVSGPDTPGLQSEFTWPRDLKPELLDAVPSYEIHGDYWGRVTAEEYLRRLVATVESHGQAWAYLLEKFAPDCFVGVFGSSDRAQHFLWKYAGASGAGMAPGKVNPLLAVYQAIDRAVASCLAVLGEKTTVAVMSDHGGGPCDKAVYLDRWLQEQSLLVYRSDERWHRSLLRRGYQWSRGALPRSLKDWLKHRFSDARQQMEGAVLRPPIDWERTRAFFTGTESAYVYLNLRGRFPQGTVAPGKEAEDLRRRIADGLAAVRDPETGESIVEAIYRREEIYHGEPEHLALLPDLVVNWKGYHYVVRSAWGEPAASPRVIVERGLRTGDAGRLMALELSGCHRPEGLLLVSGPGIAPGTAIRGASIMDLAPTVLSWFGLPAPAEMDGRVLSLEQSVGSPPERVP
jgi:predicted AlkP superfamily phosphohydrolase/phosphomutase